MCLRKFVDLRTGAAERFESWEGQKNIFGGLVANYAIHTLLIEA